MDRGAWRGYSPWSRKELDTTDQLRTAQHIYMYIYIYVYIYSNSAHTDI